MRLSLVSKSLIVTAVFSLALLTIPIAQLQAQSNNVGPNLDETCIKSGLCTSSTVGKGKEEARGNLAKLIGSIINTMLSLVGVLFMFFIITAGQMWMTAGGNSETVMQARTMMLNAAYGLLVVGVAYILTSFILGVLVQWVTNTGT
jgi:hypothetical protein